MSRHLTCDGTRFHHEGRRVRAADLQPGDTYSIGARTSTVTGTPYPERVDTVEVMRVPVRTHDGLHLVDTVSPDGVGP